jgi:hypothetical protein
VETLIPPKSNVQCSLCLTRKMTFQFSNNGPCSVSAEIQSPISGVTNNREYGLAGSTVDEEKRMAAQIIDKNSQENFGPCLNNEGGHDFCAQRPHCGLSPRCCCSEKKIRIESGHNVYPAAKNSSFQLNCNWVYVEREEVAEIPGIAKRNNNSRRSWIWKNNLRFRNPPCAYFFRRPIKQRNANKPL